MIALLMTLIHVRSSKDLEIFIGLSMILDSFGLLITAALISEFIAKLQY